MNKKPLLDLKRFTNRKNNNIFALKFRSLGKALFYLDRKLPETNFQIFLTKLKFNNIISHSFLSSKVFAFCPLKNKFKDKCINCSFNSGTCLSIDPIILNGYFNPLEIQEFVRNQIQIKFTFWCKKSIVPQYKLLEKDRLLVELSTDFKQNIYLFVDSSVDINYVKKLYVGYNFYGFLNINVIRDNIFFSCYEFNLKTKDINRYISEFLFSFESEGITDSGQICSITKQYLNMIRISKRKWNNLGFSENILINLKKFGFLSYNNYRYYRTYKLSKILKIWQEVNCGKN